MANIYSVPQDFSTTLNVGGGIDSSQTTGIVLTSVTGLPTDGGILCFDWASTLDTSVAEFIEYTGISGNTLTGVIRGAEGISAKAHSNGAVIAGVISQAHIKRPKEKLDGTDTTGASIKQITDTSLNEVVTFTKVASAVNQVDISNNSTGNAPIISATGDDTNIDLKLVAKGTGKVRNDAKYGVITTDTDGTTVTFNCATSNQHAVTLGGNRTLALSNDSAGEVIMLDLIQDATGSRTVTWFSGIKWDGGSAPTLTTTASKVDTIGIRVITAGSAYYGYIVGQNL